MAGTQIATRQIQNGAVLDGQVGASANIASTKLADGLNWIKKDGSVAMTGALPMGAQKITNLGTPTLTGDATTKAYVDAAVAAVNNVFTSKAPVRAMATATVLISNPGTAVFDGVTLANGDRIALLNQTTASENGIYVFNGSGVAMTRAADANTWAELVGGLFSVDEGTANAGKLMMFTIPQAGTIGTTNVTTQLVNSVGLQGTNFVDSEVPSGTINGSNTTFTLANTPVAGTVKLSLNGVRQLVGAGNDYTISGSSITMLTAPSGTDTLLADYRK